MSNIYIQRLRGVQREFNSAREAIRYVQRNWQRYDIYADLPGLKPANFEEAGRNAEVTYFVRLYAEFEGILKDHLATNHPAVAVPDKPKVDKLIGLVAKAEGFILDSALRHKDGCSARLPQFGCPPCPRCRTVRHPCGCIVKLQSLSCQAARTTHMILR